jgi:NAD(P)-dependent dehydrogenase (short-subunit alcohol dehydrogenase family)
MTLLAGKTALITGASSGIGRAIALRFAEQGANLIITGRDAGRLADTEAQARASGADIFARTGDICDERLHAALIEGATDRFGGLDIAVNNAGAVGTMAPLAELSLAQWQDVMDVNLTSAFLGARHQIPALLSRGGGVMMFTSTFVGTSVGIPGMAAYAASKAALMGLVKGITADYAAQGVRANALIVGGTDTPAAGSEEQKIWAAGLHAMKRIAQPEEIANAALFLASGMASFVAGSALYVDGGNAAVK